ncbi:MAG: hypothetical protein K2X35_26405 [Bryobacteraceae bacterium]|nr:hypothetical protein [Bryobacteraceae bacterium]
MTIYLAALLSLGLFAGILALFEYGRHLSARRRTLEPEGGRGGTGTVDAAISALLGLLLAFTVNGAGSRFDTRRQLIVEETNAIGTAYLRLDVLPPAAQPPLREALRRYVGVRLDAYSKIGDDAAVAGAWTRGEELQQEIWRQAVAGIRADGAAPQASSVLLPSLNAMIDITTTRAMATRMHPPLIIYIMLCALALLSAFLSGYSTGGTTTRPWLHMLCFAFAIAITFYVTLDLESDSSAWTISTRR